MKANDSLGYRALATKRNRCCLVRSTLTRKDHRLQKISFRVSNLDLWLNRSGLKYETSREVHGAFTASYEHPGFIKLHTNHRFELGVWHSTSIPMFGGNNVLGDISEKAYLNLEYTSLATLKEVMNDILMIRDFMSLVMATPIVVEDAVIYLDGSKEITREDSTSSSHWAMTIPLGKRRRVAT